MKKNLDDCVVLISSEEIRNFIKEALAKAPKQFWKGPCSGTGKHHPREDNVDGGIIVHTRKAVQVAISLFRFFDVKDKLIKDKIIAAVILHDIKKDSILCMQKDGTLQGKATDKEHGPIAARWLFCLAGSEINEDLFDVCCLVANHMGLWNKPKPTPAIKAGLELDEKSIWHLIVQLADYWASRDWCSFICDDFIND